MKEYTFMPTLEIQTWGEIDKDSDLFQIDHITDETYSDSKEGGWYSSLPVDVEKLSAFIEPVINYRTTDDSTTKYVSTTLRRCERADFKDYPFKNENETLKYERRLCPDYQKMDELFAQNGYQNTVDRKSFSLEIFVCNKGDICKSEPEIKKMLEHIMFNVYIVRQDVEIGNNKNYFESPLITKDTFHS